MKHQLISIAFYNVENLFDTINAAHTLDQDFTPKGEKKWSPYRYNLKIQKLGKAISKIGQNKSTLPPALIGLAEVENKTVLEALIHSDALTHLPYDYIHYDSPDERGIDVALLYNKDLFKPLESEAIPILIYDAENIRDYTRDILFVKGKLNGKLVNIFVNHWPSRRLGTGETRLKRIFLAKQVHKKIEDLKSPNSNIIVMGDFNDNPTNESVQNHLAIKGIQNPMLKLYKQGLGSSKFYGEWMLFDQILLSSSFFESKCLSFVKAYIYNETFLTDPKRKKKKEPFRTYTGKYYQGGFSDHFPVYVLLKTKN